ncbi:epoxide hydrolase 1, partial [Deltaproteobacteria bacterium]|nr:epoxide hydrolase 1 [Deltaproteobacteria bacterium]
MSRIETFTIDITDSAIADLQQRLTQARWPDQVNDNDWSYGTDLKYLKALISYWRNEFDWNKQQSTLNQFPQYRMEIDGQWLHYIHQLSPHAHARPLLICHGWPGSIVEFLELIPRLTEPEKFGGRAEDACHVICPSLPGYAFSEAPGEKGMNTRAMARKMIQLMAG